MPSKPASPVPKGDPQRPRLPSDNDHSSAPCARRMIGERISVERICAAKRAFVTRRSDLSAAHFLALPAIPPQAGDILLARVVSLGQHGRIELVGGRRSHMFIGDEVIVAYGERYAADQFHSKLPADLSECDLVAAGGIASQVIEKNSRIKKATRIAPIGLLADASGLPLNLAQSALRTPERNIEARQKLQVIAVVGSAMNAGKTTTAANIVHCLKRAGIKVAACKATGTGAGGDVWRLLDAGASPVLDFTDAGLASTYNVPPAEIKTALRLLIANIASSGAQTIVIEVADGLFQKETSDLLKSPYFRSLVDHIAFAAGDAISAAAGVQILDAWGYSPSAISGALTASPLAVAETEAITGMNVLTNHKFQHDETVLTSLLQSARKGATPL